MTRKKCLVDILSATSSADIKVVFDDDQSFDQSTKSYPPLPSVKALLHQCLTTEDLLLQYNKDYFIFSC